MKGYRKNVSNSLDSSTEILSVLKHGAIVYNEAEVFNLSITNPNGRPTLPFDWLIHSTLILASCRVAELPSCRVVVFVPVFCE